MSLNNEISHPEKVCKYCEISKPLEKFRPKSRMCNQCTNSRQNLNRIGKNRRYYLKHTDEIKARVNKYYYKKKQEQEQEQEQKQQEQQHQQELNKINETINLIYSQN